MAHHAQKHLHNCHRLIHSRLLMFVLLSIYSLQALALDRVEALLSKGPEIPGKIAVGTTNSAELEPSLNRPRLYLNSGKIELIRLKQGKYPYSKFWNAVREKMNKAIKERPPATTTGIGEGDLWMLGDGLPNLALGYLVTGHPDYLEGARKWMDALCSYSDWASNKDVGAAVLLFNMSIAYDWLHNEFTPEELNRYGQKMAKHANILYQSLVKKDMWWARPEYQMQGHNYSNVMSIAIAGLALRGERHEADLWLAAANANFNGVLQLLSPDGASHEGVGYWGGGVDWLLRYFLANPVIQGKHTIESNQFFRNTTRFRLYASMPDYVESVDYADSPRYEWVGPGYMLRALASIFKDGHAQWLAERIEKARGNDAKYSWLDLIWYDESVRPIPPDDLPTYAYFDNLGIFISRSDWTEKAIWTFFKAGPSQGKLAESNGIFTGSHIHPDEGTFLMWGGGQWLVVDDGYVFRKRTENHNVLLFNGKGQLGEGQQWFDLYSVKQHKGTASIVFTSLRQDYQYLTAELAGMYPPEAGVKSWKRSFITLPHGRVIVRDRITWLRPGKVVSRVHFGREPKQYAPHAACLGSKEGLVVNALLPKDASFKIGKYEIAENERVRSTNAIGGLLEIENGQTETFLLFLDAGSGGCGGEDYTLIAHPSGNLLGIKDTKESTTVDFSNNSVTINPQ
jgi:hypothetical protein